MSATTTETLCQNPLCHALARDEDGNALPGQVEHYHAGEGATGADSARTCWAEDMGLCGEAIEALTEIAEEAGDDVELDARDVWARWPLALEEADMPELAGRVRELATTHFGAPCCEEAEKA